MRVLSLVDRARERAHDVGHSSAGRRRYDERRLLGGALEPRGLLLQLFRCQYIGLVEGYDFGLVA